MSKQLLLIFLNVLLTLTVFANNDYSNWWNDGNNYYQLKNYDSAAYFYNKIAEQHPDNAEVYYNLGNTYYRLNKIGLSILNYERALKLAPNNKLASDNLYLAQSRINNRIQKIPEIFFLRWWRSMTRSNLANIYAIVAAILFLALLAYHITRKISLFNTTLPVQASVAVIVLTVLFLALSIVSSQRLTGDGYGIIMTENSTLMAEPKFGKSLSMIPEGTKVEITGEQQSWMEVILPDGRTGWIQQADLEKI